MLEHRSYQVGGHTFILDFPEEMLSEKELAPYAPFQTADYREEDLLFTLTLVRETENRTIYTIENETVSFKDENGQMILYSLPDGGVSVHLISDPAVQSADECCRLYMSPDYRQATAMLSSSPEELRYALDTALMLLYAFASSRRDTLLIHASAIGHNGMGYLFLGRSGTGKSTHSRLWIDHIPGSELINDDNPVVRVTDGKIYVYGSPWSGKTPCYRDKSLPVGAIVRLKQSPRNSIVRLASVMAYAALLPACSCLKWDRPMAAGVHDTLRRIVDSVPVFSMECRPDREAALTCMEAVKNNSF